MSDEPNLSHRYRELPREEPPRALDDAILSASRRALVRRRRWAVPLAAAAAITLAVAVTLQVRHDRPAEEVDAVSPAMKLQEAPEPEAAKAERARRSPQPFAAAPSAPASADAPARESRPAAGARLEASRALGKVGSPEQALERIARLRAAGRHEQADKALAEFRKRYPDYRLSDEMKAKVERRQ